MPTDDLESGNSQGTQAQPTPGASGGGSASQPSNDADALYQRLEQSLLSKLEPRLQSLTDKRFKKVENEQTDIRAFMEKVKPYMDSGMNLEQATREVELNEALQFYRTAKGQPTAQPAQARQESGADPAVEKAIRKYGLDTNDAEVVQALRDNDDQFDKIAALASLSVRRQSSPQPTAAANAAPSGGQTIPPETRDSLKAAYTTEMLTARGNRQLIKNIQAKYKAKGLDIENIGFQV